MENIQKAIEESIRLEKAHRFNEAFALLTETRKKAPGSRPLHLRVAQLYEAIKQPDAALHIYQQLADAQPDKLEPMLQLGMARSLLALPQPQLEPAETILKRLQVQAPHPDVFTGLASIRRQKDDLQAARELVSQALKLAPGYKPATHELALIQLATKEMDAALATLESNCLREDQYGDSLDTWLNTLRDLKRERYVQEKLEEAAAKWPHKVEFVFGLGVQAHRQGEILKARRALEQADKLSPSNYRILHEWGVMERMSGDIDLSQKLLGQSLELFPEQPAALRTYGTEHKYAYGDAEFTRLNYAAAKLADVEPVEQVHLHYALGKAFEDVNELDTAFRHYETAGMKKRRLEKYDERASSRMFSILPQIVNKDTRKLYSEKGFDSDVPVFILGMPRSGTSLLEQILSSHPDIFGAGELKFLPPAVDNIRYGNNRINLNEPEPAFPYDAEASWEARGKWYVEHLQALADKPTYKRIVDKMPGNFTIAAMIPAILPNAKIIHSRRHPVETCLSNYRIHFAEGQYWSYHLRELGRYYKKYWELMKHWREQFPGMMYEVRYEDNVADVEGQARSLIDYLGLPWYEGVLEFYNADRPVKTASATQVRKPIYTTSTNRWRKYEKYLQPLIEELGDIVPQYEAEIAHLTPKS